MAAPLTWQNVATPDLRNSLDGIRVSGEALNRAFGGMDASLGRFDDRRREQAASDLMNQAANYGTPEELRAAQADGSLYNGVNRGLLSPEALGRVDNRVTSLLANATNTEALNQSRLINPELLTKQTLANDAARLEYNFNAAVDPTRRNLYTTSANTIMRNDANAVQEEKFQLQAADLLNNFRDRGSLREVQEAIERTQGYDPRVLTLALAAAPGRFGAMPATAPSVSADGLPVGVPVVPPRVAAPLAAAAGAAAAAGSPTGGRAAPPAPPGAPIVDPVVRNAFDLATAASVNPATTRTVAMSTPDVPAFVRITRDVESGNRVGARNPLSTATGTAQFIDGTYLEFAQANPQLFPNMDRAQILATRSDPNFAGVQDQATLWYAGRNAPILRNRGIPTSDTNLAIAHRFGPGGATQVINAAENAPMTQVLPGVIASNPELKTMTAGQVRQVFANRFGNGQSWRDSVRAPTAEAAPGAIALAATRPGTMPIATVNAPANLNTASAAASTMPATGFQQRVGGLTAEERAALVIDPFSQSPQDVGANASTILNRLSGFTTQRLASGINAQFADVLGDRTTTRQVAVDRLAANYPGVARDIISNRVDEILAMSPTNMTPALAEAYLNRWGTLDRDASLGIGRSNAIDRNRDAIERAVKDLDSNTTQESIQAARRAEVLQTTFAQQYQAYVNAQRALQTYTDRGIRTNSGYEAQLVAEARRTAMALRAISQESMKTTYDRATPELPQSETRGQTSATPSNALIRTYEGNVPDFYGPNTRNPLIPGGG